MAEDAEVAGFRAPSAAGDYVLTRAVLLRGLGFLYVVAFAILVKQVLPLVGSRGLLPVQPFLARVESHFETAPRAFWGLPTLFWIESSDFALLAAAWLGVVLGALVLAGIANAPILASLWALYLSFVHVGQVFYGYGWDTLLCETGFLAIFLAPVFRPGLLSPREPPPFVVIVLLRWLTFRIMFGAGLIKLRGDECWTELRCLDFHYETQPNPGPLSSLFHFAPAWTRTAGVLLNHLAELIAPFGVFGPRRVRLVAGIVIVTFQSILILSGNLSFLNWLTLLIALACFDDGVFLRLMPRAQRSRLLSLKRAAAEPSRARRMTVLGLALVIGALSLNPIVNLLSSRQLMNASFEPFNLVNTYGAFGSVSRERHEVVLEGTSGAPDDPNAVWREYEFPCKPGDVRRRPCLITPYHYRLDWQLWFAGLSNFQREPWIVHLAYQLLRGEPTLKSQLALDPFPDHPPRFVRARLYRYTFAPLGERGVHWHRNLIDEYLQPLSLDHVDFRHFLEMHGWLAAEP
jgi:hypothetical protein